MYIKDVKALIKAMVESKLKVTPMLWGRHGLGKSAGVNQAGAELGYRVLDIRLAQKEAIDIAGMLFTFADEKLGLSVTASHPPQWFADALKNGKIIIFFDEFNMARQEVTNATFEIVLDRKLNNLPLPDDVFIICAGNPEDERYQTTPMSESLRDRLMHIKVESSHPHWLIWAEESKINPHIVSFIRATPQALYHSNTKDEKFPVEIRHSERSWERASKVMELKMDDDLKYECLCGIVGQEIATAFFKTIEKENMPITVKEIFAGKKETWDRITRYRKEMRNDLMAITVNNLVDYSLKNVAESTKYLTNIMQFITLLPEEPSQVIIQATRNIGDGVWAGAFLKHPEIHEKMKAINKVIQEVKSHQATAAAATAAKSM